MPIAFKKDRAQFNEIVTVEEAETLLEWLQKHPKGKLDLGACTHLHPANLQVLMAAGCSIQTYPKDSSLAEWLKTALPH